jgi:hypothetical protein
MYPIPCFIYMARKELKESVRRIFQTKFQQQNFLETIPVNVQIKHYIKEYGRRRIIASKKRSRNNFV